MHKLFKVVTKAAIYNNDKSKVLVIHMDQNNDYGLPGGHIEEKEDMNSTMQRELLEECGIKAKKTCRKLIFSFTQMEKLYLPMRGYPILTM